MILNSSEVKRLASGKPWQRSENSALRADAVGIKRNPSFRALCDIVNWKTRYWLQNDKRHETLVVTTWYWTPPRSLLIPTNLADFGKCEHKLRCVGFAIQHDILSGFAIRQHFRCEQFPSDVEWKAGEDGFEILKITRCGLQIRTNEGGVKYLIRFFNIFGGNR